MTKENAQEVLRIMDKIRELNNALEVLENTDKAIDIKCYNSKEEFSRSESLFISNEELLQSIKEVVTIRIKSELFNYESKLSVL